MRSLLSKFAATAAVLFMVLGFVAGPAASAQAYPPVAPGAVDCVSLPAPSVAIVGTDVVATFAQGSLTCIVRVVIQVNPVLYDGPPPVGSKLVRALPSLVGDDHTATVTAHDASGTQKAASVKVSPSALAAARASGVPASTADVPTATDAAPAPQALAFTGGDVNLPLAAGAILVGAGGLTLLAARKREQNA